MSQEDVTKEYLQFTNYFYLDWQILSYLSDVVEGKNDDTSTNQSAQCLNYLFKHKIDRNKNCFPYSAAHIQDILNGEEQYLDKKMGVIQSISKGWKIRSDEKEKELLRVDKSFDVNEDIQEFKSAQIFTKDVQSSFFPLIQMGLESVKSTYANEQSMNNLLQHQINDWDDFNKVSFKSIINDRIEKNPLNLSEVISMNREDINNEINKRLQKSHLPFKTIEEFEQWNKKNNFDKFISKFDTKLNCYFLLCDIIGFTKEKNQKKKTFPRNVFNDCTHLSFGIRCHNFVTHDKNLLIKAIVCKKLFNLSVKIFDFDEFIQYLLQDDLFLNHQGLESKNYKFQSLNGKIKEYDVDVKTQYFN
jgi:hypothetical protein